MEIIRFELLPPDIYFSIRTSFHKSLEYILQHLLTYYLNATRYFENIGLYQYILWVTLKMHVDFKIFDLISTCLFYVRNTLLSDIFVFKSRVLDF